MMKLMKRLKPYWLSITAVLVLTFGQVIGQLYLPTLMSNIIDKGVVTGDTDYIWSTGMLYHLLQLFCRSSSFISHPEFRWDSGKIYAIKFLQR